LTESDDKERLFPTFRDLVHNQARPEAQLMNDPRNVIIALLSIAVAVLGYLYYESQRTKVSIDVPGFKLEAR
jgi:hypothetical protein